MIMEIFANSLVGYFIKKKHSKCIEVIADITVFNGLLCAFLLLLCEEKIKA